MPIPRVKQLSLNEEARSKLERLIQDDYTRDSADLAGRSKAMTRWYQLWRNNITPNGFPDIDEPNFSIPLVPWMILAKLAKEMDALLGEESEVVVTPIGKSDIERVKKVKNWMNWRIKHSLNLFEPLYDYLLQKNIFGTTIGCLEWITRKRLIKKLEPVYTWRPSFSLTPPFLKMEQVQVGQNVVETEVVEHDGPVFTVENLEDWVLPVRTRDLKTADHYTRRMFPSLEDVLDMRDNGILEFDEETLELLRTLPDDVKQQDQSANPETVSQEKDAQQGIPNVPQGRQGEIELWNWTGWFRPDDAERSQRIVAFFQPQRKKLLGVMRLVDLCPDGRDRFICSRAVRDPNIFWGRGLAEFLEAISNEMDAFHRLATQAGEGAIGPVIFYSPAAGFNPDQRKMEPYTAVPCADPNAVKVVNLGQINMGPYVLIIQQLIGFSENITALTQAQLGRTSDRPNAPRTYGQQALLQAESNTRLLLDIRLERTSLKELLNRVWEMDKMWLPKPYFFRVTEESGDDVLTAEDMMGEYDFDIGPVTSVANKAVRLQEDMQALALSVQIGLPQAVFPMLKKVLTKLGHPDVAANIPDPQLKQQLTPEEENVRMFQGQDVDPHPMDNDAVHIAKHEEFKQRMMNTPLQIPGQAAPAEGEAAPVERMWADSNPGLIGRIDAHIAEHKAKMAGGNILGMFQAGAMPVNGGSTPANGQGGLSALQQMLGQQQSPVEQAQSATASLVNTGPLNLQ